MVKAQRDSCEQRQNPIGSYPERRCLRFGDEDEAQTLEVTFRSVRVLRVKRRTSER